MIGCVVILVVTTISVAFPPPVRPYPDQFTVDYSCDGTVGPNLNTWIWDITNQRNRIDTNVSSPSMQPEREIDRWDLIPTLGSLQHFSECYWMNVCTSLILVPPPQPQGVPSDATYQGTVVIQGQTTEHWHYSFKNPYCTIDEDYYVIGVPSASGLYMPVHTDITSTDTTGTSTSSCNWDALKMNTPDESEFYVDPSWNCQQGELVSERHAISAPKTEFSTIFNIPEHILGSMVVHYRELLARFDRMTNNATRATATCPPW
jgi:hypothetical protein